MKYTTNPSEEASESAQRQTNVNSAELCTIIEIAADNGMVAVRRVGDQTADDTFPARLPDDVNVAVDDTVTVSYTASGQPYVSNAVDSTYTEPSTGGIDVYTTEERPNESTVTEGDKWLEFNSWSADIYWNNELGTQQADFSGVIDSSAVYQYTNNESDVIALDVSDGSELWRTTLPSQGNSNIVQDSSAVYVVSDDDKVHRILKTDGTIDWETAANSSLEFTNYLAINSNSVFVLTDDASFTVSYDKNDGSENWTRSESFQSSEAGIPVADDTYLYRCYTNDDTSNRVIDALDVSTNSQSWSNTYTVDGFVSETAGPVLDNGLIYFINRTATSAYDLYVVNASDGAQQNVVSINTDSIVRVIVSDTYVYTIGNELIQFSKSGLSENWSILVDIQSNFHVAATIADDIYIPELGVTKVSSDGTVRYNHAYSYDTQSAVYWIVTDGTDIYYAKNDAVEKTTSDRAVKLSSSWTFDGTTWHREQ